VSPLQKKKKWIKINHFYCILLPFERFTQKGKKKKIWVVKINKIHYGDKF
jgi:hypothetical protein